MTRKKIVRDVMSYIQERVVGMDEREYDYLLEQLSIEIEETRQQLNRYPENEENGE